MLSPRFPFNRAQIESMGLPIHGVYALFERGQIIYIGQSSGFGGQIKDRLLSHLAGREGACTQSATEFAYEGTLSAVARERELLEAFETANGRLPRCNERRG